MLSLNKISPSPNSNSIATSEVGSPCMFWLKPYQWNVHFGRVDDMMAWHVNRAIPNIDASETTVALLVAWNPEVLPKLSTML